jgi:hypothetical protein
MRWMPTLPQLELLHEHAVAHMPLPATAKALGVSPRTLAAWWRWLDKWARGRPARPSAAGTRLPGHIGGRLMRYRSSHHGPHTARRGAGFGDQQAGAYQAFALPKVEG